MAADDRTQAFRDRATIGEVTMKDARNVLRIIGMILLVVFVFTVVLPLALKVVGITLVFISSLAVLLIKVAVTLAILYLGLVGIRALLR